MRTGAYWWAVITCAAALTATHLSWPTAATPGIAAAASAPSKDPLPEPTVGSQTDSAAGPATKAATAPATRAATTMAGSDVIGLEAARHALIEFATASDDPVVKSTLPDLLSKPEPDGYSDGSFFVRWHVDPADRTWHLGVGVNDPGQSFSTWRYGYSGHFFKDETGEWVARLENHGRSARGGR